MKTGFTKSSVTNKIASLLIFTFFMLAAQAGVIVSAPGYNMQISADKASNAFSPAFTRLDDIVITEKNAHDFANSAGKSRSLILTAPAGWIFKLHSGRIRFNGKDIRAVSVKTSRTTISINFSINGTASIDDMIISGIEVQSTDGAAAANAGSIYRSSLNPGNAIIQGIMSTSMANGAVGTSFAVLTQTPGNATKLVFATKPSASAAGVVFDQQPVVATQDQFGNHTANGVEANQVVKIKLSSGSGILSGTVFMNIENGIAHFTDLELNTLGSKKLIATSGTLTFAVSNEFSITEDDSSPKISSEDSEDYDPDWICFLQNTNAIPAI